MQTTVIIIGTIVLIISVLFFLARAKMKNIPLVDNHEKIVVLNDKNFQQQLKNKTVLVDFWASWCAPCRMMAPVLNEVAGETAGSNQVGKVDIEQYQSLAKQYNIRSIPTLILFKNGKEKERFVGIKSKEFLLNKLKISN